MAKWNRGIRVQTMFQLMLEYPKLTAALLVPTLVLPVLGVCIWKKEDHTTPIFKKWVTGSRPPIKDIKNAVPRLEIAEELKLFFPTQSLRSWAHFGIVYGPAGCGKTTIIKSLATEFPRGVFYYLVDHDVDFAENLARAVGLKTAPEGVLDYALSWLNPAYTPPLYRLKGEPMTVKAGVLCRIIKDAAERYTKRYGDMPVLFLDGCDILAKRDASVVETLIQFAKTFADDRVMTIVLVSSDGSILPILHKSSLCTARSVIFEVGDISDESAIKYLTSNGLPQNVSTEVTKYVGGRLVHLNHSLSCYVNGDGPNDVIVKIKKKIESELGIAHYTVGDLEPSSKIVLKHLSHGNIIAQNEIPKGDINMRMVVDRLVGVNILRYDAALKVKWHSRVMKKEFTQN